MRKLSGKNANGNPGYFSADQKRKIVEGIKKLLAELERR
jgi:hypothetical protein